MCCSGLLRTVYDDGQTITTSIIAMKNNVAPLKSTLRIPHLKLSGATIPACLLQSVKSELEPFFIWLLSLGRFIYYAVLDQE